MQEPVENTALLVSRDGPTGIITFNKPDERNALSRQVLESIGDEMTKFSSDESCGSIIFTGTGRTFAAGANLKHLAGFTHDEARDFGRIGQALFENIRDFKGKVVAAVNGICMGGALDLALSCDYRIASPGAKFAHPGVRLGIITGWGGTQLLPRLVGSKNAYKLLLTAEAIEADEALAIGLIDEVAEDPLKRAIKYVED